MSLPGAERDVDVGQRRGAGEARVDVDDRRAALLGLHDEAEPDRVVLGHVRAHDHDAVAVGQVLLGGRRAAATERAPRPGTVLECHMRAWFSTATMPRPAVKSFLIR